MSSTTAADYTARWSRRGGDLSNSLGPSLALHETPPQFSDAERLRLQLQQQVRASRRGSGAQLELVLTNNRTTMISVRREPGRYRLRLHHIFLGASSSMLSALSRYITDNDPRASVELGEFIDLHQEKLPPQENGAPRRLRLVHKGRRHDLKELFDRLNARYFHGAIDARITWSSAPRREGPPRRHRSLKMGSYAVEDRLIRIHPTLDQPSVPTYFIEWIIYHEMLHQKHPIPVIAGRRCFHTPAFLAEERLFDEYQRAHLWERRNLHRLLVY